MYFEKKDKKIYENVIYLFKIKPAGVAKSFKSCPTLWPHRRQPTRLPHPWDSPGKNIGVGCHFLLQCMKVKSEREVTQSCLTLCDPMDCTLPGSSVHGIFQARVLVWSAIAFSKNKVYKVIKKTVKTIYYLQLEINYHLYLGVETLDLTVVLIMNSLLPNADWNWRKWRKLLDHSGMT